MYKKRLVRPYMVGVLFLSITPIVEAKIYKCVNIENKVFYNDKPCPILDKETKINAVKDPVGGYIPPALVLDVKQKNANLLVKKKVDDTFSNNEKKVVPVLSNSDNKASLNEGSNRGSSAPVIASSGRVPVSFGEGVSPTLAKRYIMKVEEKVREPQ